MANFPWTAEQVALLERLWKDGFSSLEIARRLGAPSRSSVIGKAHRVGLRRRQPGARSGRGAASANALKPTRTSSGTITKRQIIAGLLRDPIPRNESDVARVSLADREPHQCCWPVGEPQAADFGYCGLQKVAGLNYCAAHARRLYQSATPRTRAAAPKAASNVQNPETIEA